MFSNRLLKCRVAHKLSSNFLKQRNLHVTSVVLNEAAAEDTQSEDRITKFRKNLLNGPNLRNFFTPENLSLVDLSEVNDVPYLKQTHTYGNLRKVYFEVYGCQMNVNDTDIIWSILKTHKFLKTDNVMEADVVLLITCAIRESAEEKIWSRLKHLKGINRIRKDKLLVGPMKIGILGCMAERLKHKVLEIDKTVDVVAGPDSYKDLPRLLAVTENNQTAVNVLLSLDETYADIMPVRLNKDSISAFVSIMRGCDNMCTYCIVPFTRGRERSRPIDSILDEVKQLRDQGVKEITLLGQNVNSYRDLSKGKGDNHTNLAKGFKTVYKTKVGGTRFADLLHQVAEVDPEVRIRFTSPHPKDFPDEVLEIIRDYPNVCRSLHLPAQSGNSAVLERMRRGYTRDAYLQLVEHIRSILPNISLSTDMICGFCGETEEEFEETISLMEIVKYNKAFLFPYSMREKTTAHRRFNDDVPDAVKRRRLAKMNEVYRLFADRLNRQQVGTKQLILIEGQSRRSARKMAGRNDGNIKVIVSQGELAYRDGSSYGLLAPGDYVVAQIFDSSSQVLKGVPLYKSTIKDFYSESDVKHKEEYYSQYMNVS